MSSYSAPDRAVAASKAAVSGHLTDKHVRQVLEAGAPVAVGHAIRTIIGDAYLPGEVRDWLERQADWYDPDGAEAATW